MEHTNWREEFESEFSEWLRAYNNGEQTPVEGKLKSFIEKVEAAAFKRGLERAEEIIRNLKVRAASKDLEGIADIHRHFLDETREILFAALKEAARLPDEGADKK